MRAVVTPFFTRVVEKLPPISAKLRGLLNQQITETILSKHEFPKVKSEILEIWIDTSPEIAELEIVSMSKTGRGKYLSFTFVMPYHKVMKDESQWIGVFIDEFFGGLAQILTPYQVPESEIAALCEVVKKEVIGNEDYVEKPSRDKEYINKLLLKNKKEKV